MHLCFFCDVFVIMTLNDFPDSFHWHSLLLTVLDAFHFDHESLSKEIEAAKKKKTEGKSATTAALNFLFTHIELNMTNIIY